MSYGPIASLRQLLSVLRLHVGYMLQRGWYSIKLKRKQK